MSDIKEIKAEIRRLKKLKLQCRPGTSERLELEHKIKDLKEQLGAINKPEPGKDRLIDEIKRLEVEYKITPKFEVLGIDLRKFSEKELQKHIDRIKEKKH